MLNYHVASIKHHGMPGTPSWLVTSHFTMVGQATKIDDDCVIERGYTDIALRKDRRVAFLHVVLSQSHVQLLDLEVDDMLVARFSWLSCNSKTGHINVTGARVFAPT
jgi:hypothetical protein